MAKFWQHGRIGVGVALLLATYLLDAPYALAQATARDALAIYARLPPAILEDSFSFGNHPDEAGLSDHNAREHQWLEVGQQRGPLQALVIAAVRGDQRLVDRQWPAVDVAFAHQRPDGSFEQAPVIEGHRTGPNDGPTSAAFFVASLSNGCLLLQASTLAAPMHARIEMVRQRLRPTLAWLSSPPMIEAMMHVDGQTTNRIFMDGEALILGGLLVGDGHAVDQGRRMVGLGLSRQTPDGVFPEKGGGDSSYQAASIYVLDELAAMTDRAQLMPALQRAVEWELTRIGPNGAVATAGNSRTGLGQETYFGKPKGVNTPEIVRALALYGAMSGDPRAIAAANAVRASHS